MAASALRAKNKGSIEYNGASRGEVQTRGRLYCSGAGTLLAFCLLFFACIRTRFLRHAPAHFRAPLHRNVEEDHARVGVAEVVLEPQAHVAWVAEAQEAEAEHREQQHEKSPCRAVHRVLRVLGQSSEAR